MCIWALSPRLSSWVLGIACLDKLQMTSDLQCMHDTNKTWKGLIKKKKKKKGELVEKQKFSLQNFITAVYIHILLKHVGVYEYPKLSKQSVIKLKAHEIQLKLKVVSLSQSWVLVWDSMSGPTCSVSQKTNLNAKGKAINLF